MTNQFIFLIYLTLLGMSFLFGFKNRLNTFNLYLLSLPMGLSIWTIMLITLYILGLPFKRVFIWLFSLLILVVLSIISKKTMFSKNNVKLNLLFLIFFSLAAWFFLFCNYSFFTNDSWRMLVGGKYWLINQTNLANLIDKGGPFSYIIQSASTIFGFDYFYAIFPLITLSFLIFYSYNLYLPFQEAKFKTKDGFLFSLIATLFLLSTMFILLNAFYFHSNLLFSIYSFIAVFGLWKRLACGSKSWLVVSVMALISSSFLRIEGPLVSLIILAILLSAKSLPIKEKIYYTIPVFIFTSTWHIKLFFSLPDYGGKYYLTKDRALLIAFLYSIALITLLLSQTTFLRRAITYLPLLMLGLLSGGWTFLIFWKGLKIQGGTLILERYNILLLNVLKYGGWGITLIVLSLIFAISLMLRKIKHESVFLYYIFAFILIINPINLFRGGWRLGWGDSGNRMLINIIFIMSFYAFLKFRSNFYSSKKIYH